MIVLFILTQQPTEAPLFAKLIVWALFLAVILLVIYKKFDGLEYLYASRFKKPFFTHLYLRKLSLSAQQLHILKNEFKFYRKLSPTQQRYFEHRVTKFIKAHQFIGKEGLQITEQIQVLIAATATMLTFGYREYKLKVIDKVLVYPRVFYSTLNKQYHKGELNPGYKAIVFSWEHFLKGYEIDNDNLNLGIHEFIHAIHINAYQQNDITAVIFLNSYAELSQFLDANDSYKARLIASDYIRHYAYENQFEFIAVLVECFIETPQEFRAQFPEVYTKIKQMLNFDFKGY